MSRLKPMMSLFVGLTVFSLPGPVLSVEKPPPGSTGVSQGPILDPKTNSYFELRVDNFDKRPDGSKGHNYWENARNRAAVKVYEGRRGRLAVVKDLDTLNFIREHFRLNESTWIGLRFYCKYRKLMWVTGEIQPLKSPGMWAPRWHRTSIKCSTQNITVMPVSLTAESTGRVAWQASGPSKSFYSYLIEYPAPPKAENKAEASSK